MISSKDGSWRETTAFELKGHSSESPTIRGGRLFIATDLGEYSVFELGAETDPQPITKAVSYVNLATTAGNPAFVRPVNESEIWIFADSASHFRVNVPRKEFELVSNHPLPGPATRESTIVGNQGWGIAADSIRGGIVALSIDSAARTVRFQTTLGTLPLGVGPVPVDNRAKLLIADLSSRELLDEADIENNSIVEKIVPTPINIDFKKYLSFEALPWPTGLVQVSAGTLLFAPSTPSKEEGIRTVILTGKVAGLPARCGGGILVPSDAGYIFWINPESGVELADPFAAPFENGQPTSLNAVVPLDFDDPSKGAIGAGGKTLFGLKLMEGEAKIWQQTSKVELAGEGNVRQLLLGGEILWAIRDKEIVALEPNELMILGTLSVLPSPVPVMISQGRPIVFTRAGEIMAVHRDKEGKIAPLWQKKLPDRPIGIPLIHQDHIWVGTPDGSVLSLHVADGQEQPMLSFQRAMASGPFLLGHSLVGVAADGSVIRLPLP